MGGDTVLKRASVQSAQARAGENQCARLHQPTLRDLKDMEQETSKRLNVWKTLGRESKGRKVIISLYKMY
jgi:hypothetical protein